MPTKKPGRTTGPKPQSKRRNPPGGNRKKKKRSAGRAAGMEYDFTPQR